MFDPLFWLGLSILLVAVSLTAVLVAALPAFRELSRAARSAEKLFDTLSRELPPTLEAIRLTGIEITDLTDDVSQGVEDAGRVVRQVDESISSVRQRAKKAQSVTRSLLIGARAAWRTFTQPVPPPRTASMQRSADRLPASTVRAADLDETNRFQPQEADTNASWFEEEQMYSSGGQAIDSATPSRQTMSSRYEAWYDDEEAPSRSSRYPDTHPDATDDLNL